MIVKLSTLFLLIALALGVAAPVTAQQAAPAPTKILDKKSPDYVRCKREKPIGSMIATLKICRTNAEWAKVGDRDSAEARKMVEDNSNRPPGGP